MSSRPRVWRLRLRHIMEAAAKIRGYSEGMTFEQFSAASMVVDAVIRNLEVIGEAARHIPLDVEEAYPQVPWADMRAMRNILAHEYESVDLSVVWDTIRNDLPPLVPLLQAVLEANDLPDR
ncbi:MAG: DUF86 domain-containing protein [Chloroflexi bacterium]|nr:DUF86 domain-containing protein [Chloroflexota bacterium]